MSTHENDPQSSPVANAPVVIAPKPSRSIPIWVLFVVAGLLVAFLAALLVKSFLSTKILESDPFAGVKPLEKRTTSIIVVHGIGNHCIGYADPLISNLMKELTDSPLEPIAQYYGRYEKSLVGAEPGKYGVRRVNGTYKGDYIDLPRDGHCNKIPLKEIAAKGLPINDADDFESAVSAQDKLCEFINKTKKDETGVRTTCHKLTVDREHVRDPGQNREYITGFVRQFEKDVSADRRVRLYEVTWSPATRWLKQSLSKVERFNSEMSAHWMNKFLKTEIMNAGIADAVAYLSESGVLVKFNVLQAFCLAMANEKLPVTDYAFTCNAERLRQSSETFSEDNDVILISHSLGTRVMLDSIGLLSLGAKRDGPAGEGDESLVTAIGTKFRQIGARVPKEYLDSSENGFEALLNKRIREFARAIRSVYVFTNQVPLLAATVTSPFSDTYQVGSGFQEFLELRGQGGNRLPLQIVSFHDPDDLLSYNLSCWYHVAVLKDSEPTLKRMDKEADFRAKLKGTEVGDERRALRDRLFNENCSKGKFRDSADRTLFEELQSSNLLALRSATVRLQGWRIQALAASPLEVHSNYFRDPRVHRWLADGHSNGHR